MDFFRWQERKTRREQVRKDLETTLELPVKGKEYGMEVRESRLSDTGRIRMGKLFGRKR